ncbi:transcriptional regulator, MarR family [Beutenbergia cavernae DSM 12333]|uniref:Transcriptional regulator, MarR family n=1 Tax=Beutenbergia cavernae (strain ATCC BAA-8 / DSM 12333 / CCUG 43141 / JCM 11478 / NBRC 16432 / NCIMB 13614 / HKI 0122) TaxID=471853 RepID=C5C043_BEUC1|nr:MarR family transcriptional regulator [Beutenbergia cavernae]ACQ79229.1 transcriptional regulator, MarR family [Beutenbergia cavernae DSM 12333]
MADGRRDDIPPSALLDPRVIDPGQEVVSHAGMDEAEITQVVRVLTAIRGWRETEQRISLASRDHMKLGETDMRALRFLVAAKNQGIAVTPGMLAEHLNISSAATTKLLDRLSAAGHVERGPHPTDRRALVVTITQSTHEQVRDTVGRTHARRFEAAARLTPDERETVVRFLRDLSGDDPPTTADAPDAGPDQHGAQPPSSPTR